jgi:hypothetical protein
MFFYQRKYKEVRVKRLKIRDEWGVLHRFELVQGIPLLTDQELADQLEVGVTTVITHRRD